MSIDKQMDKMWYTHPYAHGRTHTHTMEYYSVAKNKMPSATTWTELETVILSEVSQKEKENTIYLSYVESKIWHNCTYLWNKNRLKNIENRLVVARGWGEWWGREFGISRCKLLYIEWIMNKFLLCSAGNYIQYPTINHNGKDYKKEYIHV